MREEKTYCISIHWEQKWKFLKCTIYISIKKNQIPKINSSKRCTRPLWEFYKIFVKLFEIWRNRGTYFAHGLENLIELALCICGFYISGSNQLQIRIIPKMSQKFPKSNTQISALCWNHVTEVICRHTLLSPVRKYRLYANTTPFHIRTWGSLDFGIHGGSWDQSLVDTKGWLYF